MSASGLPNWNALTAPAQVPKLVGNTRNWSTALAASGVTFPRVAVARATLPADVPVRNDDLPRGCVG
jgi:hypothetical protein